MLQFFINNYCQFFLNLHQNLTDGQLLRLTNSYDKTQELKYIGYYECKQAMQDIQDELFTDNIMMIFGIARSN